MVAEVDYRRIVWHSRRGMLELDLILMPFVREHFRALPPEDQQIYTRLLEEEDNDLFRWFLRAERPDDTELARLVDLIIACARET